MNNKSQGLSINVIIIVAIALIVLVVLIAIFTGRLGGFSKGVDAARSCSNTCIATGSTKELADGILSCDGKYFPGKFGDVPEGKVCCCKSRGSTGSGGSQAPAANVGGATTDNTGTGDDSGAAGETTCGLRGMNCCPGRKCTGTLNCATPPAPPTCA